VIFQFRFHTTIRQPGLPVGFIGGIAGIPPITALSGEGSEGLSLSQTYTVTMLKLTNGKVTSSTVLNDGKTLYAVPTNVGPKTMPNYPALFARGFANWTTELRYLRELWTIRSTSTWAPPLTP